MKTGTMIKYVAFAVLAVASSAAQARYWHGLRDAQPVAGPAIADQDLLGKIVLVYNFNADSADANVLKRTQALYAAYDRSKLMVVGACKDETGISALVKRHGVTYPVYKDFRIYTALEKEPGTLYFSNEYGRFLWQARDAAGRRDLEKALVAEIARCGQPPGLTNGVQFVHYESMKNKLVFGQDLTQVVKGLERDVAAGAQGAAEAKRILAAIGRGREEMVCNVRSFMDYNVKAAFKFFDLYLKTFPVDKPKYEKLYTELENRAAREK